MDAGVRASSNDPRLKNKTKKKASALAAHRVDAAHEFRF